MADVHMEEAATGVKNAPSEPADGSGAAHADAGSVPQSQSGSVESKEPPQSNGSATHAKPQAMLPPPKRMMPPPKFKAPLPPAPKPAADDAEVAARAKARTAAVAAAAAAAKSSLPAQRERMVAEAAAKAYAAHQAATAPKEEAQRPADPPASQAKDAAPPQQPQKQQLKEQPEAQPAAPPAPRTAASYEPPAWSGVPDGVEYTLEEIKGGTSLGERDMSQKAFFTFGRTPNNDIVLEHPSSSRLHAVLQFNGETNAAYLYDANSAHGTFLNRRRVKPGVHVPVRVGDMIKFGQSTRDWLLGGPQELMPEEGPSKAQRLEARLTKAKEARRRKEDEIAAAQMEVALGRGDGASWGFGEDAVVEDDDGIGAVDWRAFSETRGLTDKQEKLATKVRKKEITIRNLSTECERIRAKGVNDELTAGQAATLARNERTIDVLKEEMEDLEETLNESVRDSMLGRKKASAEAVAAKKAAAERRRRLREEDEEAGSSDEDEFYDRTRTGGAAAAVAAAARPARKKAKTEEALDAGTLYAQAETLSKEAGDLEAAIDAEVKLRAGCGAGGGSAAGMAESAVPAANGVSSDGAAAAAADAAAAGQGHEPLASAPAPDAAAPAEEATDALDAFMSDMAKQAEADKVVSLRKQLVDVQKRLAQTQKLLKLADPDGYFSPGSAAARAATQRAAQQAALEAQRAEAREKQRLARLAEKQREAELAAAASAEETEDADDEAAGGPPAAAAGQPQLPVGNGTALPAGLTVRKKAVGGGAAAPAADALAAGPEPTAAAQQPAVAAPTGSRGNTPLGAAAGPAAVQGAAPAPQQPSPAEPPQASAAPLAGLEIRAKRPKPAAANSGSAAKRARHAAGGGAGSGQALGTAPRPASQQTDDGPRLLSRAELAARHQQERHAAGLDADLDALARARRGAGAEAEEMEAVWQPPEEQKGDGRTALNDKFGY